ncbi:hypothetical protein C8R44DRAFT_774851 [Mycena epipterygia]|nr:hypothetical protein C8R44DRAFT_774851 [Mycena epipterygia]
MTSGDLLASVVASDAGIDTAQEPELSIASSRLAHLLESNIPPLELEIPAIRQIISENQTRVDALNTQIDVLPNAMDRLIEECDERQECVRKHTAVVSPVRRVPPELMCEIFALTPCTRRMGEDTVYCPPWRLGHICRSWRDWVLADPSLWRTIEISNNRERRRYELFDLHDTYPSSMIETQLRLSGSVPLTVTFDGRDCGIPERQLWGLLLPQCARWSTVHLECRRNFSALSELLDVVRGRVPQLKKLELCTHAHDSDIPLSVNSFSIAPNLREVMLTDHWSPSPPIHLPWGQLTHYRGRYRSERQFEILREAAPSLVECSLGFVDGSDLSANTAPILHHLRRLYVADPDFLTHLTAPVLQVLCSTGRVPPILDFVTRCSSQLTRLVLDSCAPDDTLVRLLGALPSLQYLAIETAGWEWDVFHNFFDAMTISGASSDLCPNLTSFAYGLTYYRLMSRDEILAVVAMAQSRLHPTTASRLLSLQFFSPSDFEDEIPEETQRLAEQGLDVVFICGDEAMALITKERP